MTPDEFREIRIALGLTQIDLAKALGVVARTVRKWESQEDLSSARSIPEPVARIMRLAQKERSVIWRLAGESDAAKEEPQF